MSNSANTPPSTWQFDGLYDGQQWLEPAYCQVDQAGKLLALSRQQPNTQGAVHKVPGYAIPGFINAHSHAFQYAMTGMAEHVAEGNHIDDFWTWREAMYRLALRLSPDEMQAIATMVYAQMLRHGYTEVAEFHYLHHSPDGSRYAAAAEMSERLMAAARTAGIGLSLLPIFYRKGGFGEAARPSQCRFVCRSRDEFSMLVLDIKRAAKALSDPALSRISIGIGVHSLRAADPEDVLGVFDMTESGPIHIHVAEQKREVIDCLKYLHARPLSWLLDHASINSRYSLVHATHAESSELARLALSGATVVICPTTEANLGDGIFALRDYRNLGGEVAIGSDSQIGLSPLEELRWLDYSQRLLQHKRNTVSRPGEDSGSILCNAAWQRGNRSLGLEQKAPFAIGSDFDAVVVRTEHPAIYGKPAKHRLSALIYAADSTALLGTIKKGRFVVQDGHHRDEEAISKTYRHTMKAIIKEL